MPNELLYLRFLDRPIYSMKTDVVDNLYPLYGLIEQTTNFDELFLIFSKK